MTIHAETTILRRPIGREHSRSAAAATRVPLRFLFVGNGLDHGWGAASRRPAPTLDIAHAVRDITGSPCEVDAVGTAATTGAEVMARASGSYDGAVVAIGAHDALRLCPVADWGARLVDLVTALQTALPEGAPVLLVGVPTVHVPKRVRPLNPIALRHGARLDRVAQRLAEVRPGVRYLTAPCMGRLVGRRPSADVAASYSLPIAAALAAALRAPGAPADERGHRHEVRAALLVDRVEDLPELADIVRRAADEFGVAEAAISLFDGPLRGRVSSRGPDFAAARPFIFCETVLCTGEALVVGSDRTADERFTAEPFPHAMSTPYYSGVPVHAEDGTVLGAMCLLPDELHDDHVAELDRLRDYAQEVSDAIRRARARERVGAR